MAAINVRYPGREELQLLAADHLMDLVYFTDVDGVARGVLPSVTDHLGYHPEEFLASYPAILPAASRLNRGVDEACCHGKSLKGGVPDSPAACCREFLRKDGLTAIFEMREIILREDGEPVGRLCIGHDVTDYHRQLAELQDNNHGLMVVHHTQQLLMNAAGRRDLLQIALDAPVSMLGFPCGAVFDLMTDDAKGSLIGAKGLSPDVHSAVATFCLSKQGNPQQLEHGRESTALLFSPGHSWLSPLEASLGGEVLGLLIVCKGQPHAFVVLGGECPPNRETRRLLQSVGSLVAHALEDVVLHETLDRLRFTDARTGLYTRGYVEDFLEREQRLIRRHERTASVVTLSLVPIHDPPTEQEAEAVTAIAHGLRRKVRATDLLSSYGKAEFLFYLPETDRAGAMRLVERCSGLLDDLLRVNEAGRRLLVAIGVATSEKGQRKLTEILEEARQEMNQHIERGKRPPV